MEQETLNKYYVFIVGKQVPYIIRGTSEKDVRNDWDNCTNCTEIISHILEG